MNIRKRLSNSVIFISIAILSFVFFLPFLWMLTTSLKPESDIMGHPEWLFPRTFTFEQFLLLWSSIPFPRFFINSVIFAGGVTLISLIFDSMAGYSFAKLKFKGRNLIFILVLATLMIPFQITMIPLYLLLFKTRSLNTYWGLIVPRMTNAFGIFMLRQFFLTIPDDLLEAGRIDGLSEFNIYRTIAIPMTKMALSTLAVFHFMYNWNDFLWPLIVTNSIEMRTLPVGLALFMGEHVLEHGPIIAGTVLSIIPILIFYLLAQKTFIRGIAMTGLKI